MQARFAVGEVVRLVGAEVPGREQPRGRIIHLQWGMRREGLVYGLRLADGRHVYLAEDHLAPLRRSWGERLLCWFKLHDWPRAGNGRCRSCGARDPRRWWGGGS